MLYHYTNFDGFKGIIENKCLWCSDIRYLNDYQEVEHGKYWLRKTFDLLSSEETFKMPPYIRDVVLGLMETEITAFASSFCAAPDLLSQWRGYAGGSGLAVGFEENVLRTHLQTQLMKIQYNQDDLIKDFEKYLRQYATRRSTKINREQLANDLQDLIFSAKNDAFQEEQETRCIFTVDAAKKHPMIRAPRVRYRTRSSILIPYVEIDLSPVWEDIITEIWVGPSQYGTLAWKSVKEFAAYHKLRRAEIRPSSAPYRN